MPTAILVFLTFIFLAASNVFATDKIYINEFVSNPNPNTGEKEWVEFYNPNSFSVSLEGWILEERTGSDLTGIKQYILSNITIAAKGFAVYEFSTNSLNNSGDILTLKNQSEIVDEIAFGTAYNSKVGALEKGQSAARLPDGSESWYISPSPTKNSSNGAPPTNNATTKTNQTGNIILTEFMPNPDGGSEWAEVYNPNNFAVDAGGWKIDDVEGASSPYTVENGTEIGPKNYRVFSFSSKLNNSDDTIRLLDPQGKVIESYTYKESTKAASFAKNSSGAWQLTLTPTPGSPNKFTQSNETATTTYPKNSNISGQSLGSKTAQNEEIPPASQETFGNLNFPETTSSASSGATSINLQQKSAFKQLGSTTLILLGGIVFLAAAVYPLIPQIKKRPLMDRLTALFPFVRFKD